MIECKNCGKEITQTNRKFCDQKCKYKYFNHIRKGSAPMVKGKDEFINLYNDTDVMTAKDFDEAIELCNEFRKKEPFFSVKQKKLDF